MPAYDGGAYLMGQLSNPTATSERFAFRDCAWVGSAISSVDLPHAVCRRWTHPQRDEGEPPCGHGVRQVQRHHVIDTDEVEEAVNNWDPIYRFDTEDVAAQIGEVTVLEEMLEEINIVPNPYYAYSQYETNKLDNRVKIVNLPEVCTVRIYNLSGTLIRTYNKADPLTYVDWDLKNEANVPIAGGVYIIHIDVPGVGQAVRKWFGVMRPIDLDNF